MSKKHVDYLESLFEGVDILIEHKLKDASYDTTIICTIIDDSDSKNGRYQVTDGTIKFDAYSDSDKYKVNDQVRISVIKGDYSDKKYIIGKYVTNNNTQPMTYVSPLNTVVNITDNLVPEEKQNIGIIANKSDEPYITIWSTSLADGRFADLQANDIYSVITLRADFQTLMHNYNIKSGTYGLRLILSVKPSSNSAGCIAKTAELSSSEMFGNPYAFSISTEQAKVFDIGTEGLITNIALQLYQNNDFYDINDNKIPVSLTENIIVSNIELGFGSDLIALGDNTVKIYTENDLSYKYQGHTPSPYDRKLGYPNQLNADTNLKNLGVLWYNKNDLNEYVGFSDGIYDPNYDEIEYLELAQEDTRLTARIGREGVPTDKESLELAANIEEAKPLIESASKVVTQDLITMLRALQSQFAGIKTITDAIDTTITTLKDKMTEKDGAVKFLLSKMTTQYADILKYGSKKQNNENPTWSEYWTSTNSVNYGAAIKNAFEDVRKAINITLLEQEIAPEVAAGGAYSGYAGVYDTYKIRLEKVLTSMDLYLDPASKYRFPISVFNRDFNKLKDYETKTNWRSYVKKDLSAYDNKYCIYWFRYEKDYISDEVHQFMPNGWHRLDPTWEEYGYRVPVNSSIPTRINNPDTRPQIDGKTYNDKRLPPGEGLFNIMMRYNEPEERFVAIIFHNHNMYKSNELVFRNADHIPEVANIETGDLLIFKHGERSRNDYQCYNLTNYIMDSADASHNRCIKVSYDGLLSGDEALVDGGIYWYVPIAATMLTFDFNELESKGFVSDQHILEDGTCEYITPKPSYSKDGYACFYKKVTAIKNENTGEYNFVDDNTQIDSRDFWYKIKPYYDATAIRNSIKCEFRPAEDNDLATGEEFFNFGIMGSNGTKYTLAITPATNQVATTPSKELVLDISLRDFNNAEIDIIEGQTGDGSATGLQVSWLYKYMGDGDPDTIGDNPVTGLKIQKGSCGIVKATVSFSLSTEAEEETSGNIPITKKRTVQLETVRAIPWAAGDYYISGPTSIVYNSLGTIDNKSMFDNPYKLYALNTVTVDGVTYKSNQEIPVSWERTIHTAKIMSVTARAFYEQYMPVVNDAGGLTPAPMYLDGLDCYLIVHAYIGSGDDKTYLYHQPVVITQNRFGSSVLNDWDGSFTINEKNGTILSTMIGAGRKTIENTFEGVLMGDVAVGSDADVGSQQANDIGLSNHTGLGIYGFNDGAQSFGFNIDGTAFLGKSGRGRIMFNGNYGVIASANWFAGENNTEHPDYNADTNPRPNGGKIGTDGKIRQASNAGMCINLEDGHIDSYNFKLTSAGIQLNSNPAEEENFVDIGNEHGKLTLSKDGELAIDVDRFTLTNNQVLGGANLLYQTNPQKTKLVKEIIKNNAIQIQMRDDFGNVIEGTTEPKSEFKFTYTWDLSKWLISEGCNLSAEHYDPKNEKDNYIVFKTNNKTDAALSQKVTLKANTYYTLSGYVNQKIKFNIDGNYNGTIKDNSWNFFTFTFNSGAGIQTISFSPESVSNQEIKLYHLQLEEGRIPTDWKPSSSDVSDSIDINNDNYDTQLTQDRIFDKLTLDPSTGNRMVGIWMNPIYEGEMQRNELYISASYISTGILRSNNWDGIFGENGISKQPTVGTYWNLDTGDLWSAKFMLNAGEKNADNFLGLYSEDQNENDKYTIRYNDETPISESLNTWRILAGKSFGVTKDGHLYAANAKIGGYIDATAGYIGDIIVEDGGIRAESQYQSPEAIEENNKYEITNVTENTFDANFSSDKVHLNFHYRITDFEKIIDMKFNSATTVYLVRNLPKPEDATVTYGFLKRYSGVHIEISTAVLNEYSSAELYLLVIQNEPSFNLATSFSISREGKITATYANIKSGYIGAWSLANSYIKSTKTISGISYTTALYNSYPDNNNYRLVIGKTNSPAFTVDRDGKLRASGAILSNLQVNTTLLMKGNAYIGNSDSHNVANQKEQLYVAGDAGIFGQMYVGAIDKKPDSQSVQLYISGSTLIKGDLTIESNYIYFNDDNKIYNNGNNFYIYSGSYIYLNSNRIKIGTNSVEDTAVKSRIGIGASPVVSSNYILTLPPANQIYIYRSQSTEDGTSLKTYIEEQSGVTIGGTTNNYYTFSGNASTALALSANEDGSSIRLKAPSGAGTAGQFLKLTNANGNTSWVDLPTATTSAYGTVKVHSIATTAQTISGSERNYGVEMNSDGKLYVNVPWTDTNTTYSAGTGISINDKTISCNTKTMATHAWVEENYCGITGTTITNIKNRLTSIEERLDALEK